MNAISTVLAGLMMISQAPMDCNANTELSAEKSALVRHISDMNLTQGQWHGGDKTAALQPAQVEAPAELKTRNVKITYYCPCYTCNGNTLRRGQWGAYLRDGMIASKDLPRGTKVKINGKTYVVEDRCARSGVIDIFVDKPHSQVYNMGSYRANVQVLK